MNHNLKQFCLLLLAMAVLCGAMLGQETQPLGGLRGQVTDPTGAVVVGAEISITMPDGVSRKAVSDLQGKYVVRGLKEGSVTLRATAPGFAAYEMPNVIVRPGETQDFDIELGIPMKHEQVTVQSEGGGVGVDVSPENNAGAIILKGEDLEALPDDPDELQQDLQALAGPAVGPNGGEIYIDGFTGGTLPPKSSIREIRINQNPFSAEYDKAGYGRVEVFTKPGTDKWHGQAMFNGNNSVFNSLNPFGPTSVPSYHSEIYNGNASGALKKNLSIFLNAERRNIDELGVVAPIPVFEPNGEAVLSPRRRNNLSGRLDWQLTPGNTLTARYQIESNDQQNLGIGGITLASRGYDSNETEHMVQISDTQIVSPHLINEIRFQFLRNETTLTANVAGAAINVLGVVNEGGNTIGHSSEVVDRYELQNLTSWSAGKHFVKFGGRLRVIHDSSIAPTNFNGTFTFSTLADFNSGTTSQFSIVLGNPRTTLSFADAAAFGEDDWKLRPNLTFSYGLRVETQSSIHDKLDFAPRVVLSWGLSHDKKPPKTVLRFGYGIFYDRFTEDLVLQAERQNGVSEEQFVIASPSGFPNLPCTTVADCEALGNSSPTIYQINPTLHAPYTMQSAVSLEQQLGSIGTVSLTYLNSIGERQLILENVNAPCAVGSQPFPGCAPGTRPLAAQFGNDNIYQYNSEARFRQNQLVASVQIRVSKKISLIGYYTLNYANSDTGGPNSSPSNQYNLEQDYGRAGFDVRHRLFLSGSASFAHNIRISPFVLVNSGAPFNITTGQDNNGDSFFNQRPGFVTPGCAANTPIVTSRGTFDVNPTPCERIIPINYGNGPANATVNVRFSKTFGFGAETAEPGAAAAGENPEPRPGGTRGGGRGGPGGGFGGPRGMGGIFAPSSTTRRFNLTFAVTARNLFNTVNPGPPIGVLPSDQAFLSSSNFGKSVSLAGGPFSSGTANRRVDFQAMFAF